MKISVFGLGYVGTVCAACLADRGHEVIGIDTKESKADLIRSGRSPVIEPDLDELVARGVKSGKLSATTEAKAAVLSSDLSFICVGTPSQSNGSLGLSSVESACTEIGEALRAKSTRHVVVVRSTVVPGTTRGFIVPRLVDASGRTPGEALGVAFNPEFMREGTSVGDFNNPARTIVGGLDETALQDTMSLYCDLPGLKISTTIETAELAKYVDNTWHALKVVFANEVGLVARTAGVDGRVLMEIFCADKKLNISPAYLRPGFAFGGSCLPKDVRALTYLARKHDLSLPVLDSILASNRMLVERGVDWILSQGGRRIGFLGVSFKAGTDDVRESPFVELVERLLGKGCEVRIFDPNVHLAQMIGANRDYLIGVLPHIAELVVPHILDTVEWAEIVVVTSDDPAYAAGLEKVRPEQKVLDFAGIQTKHSQAVTPQRFV